MKDERQKAVSQPGWPCTCAIVIPPTRSLHLIIVIEMGSLYEYTEVIYSYPEFTRSGFQWLLSFTCSHISTS